MIDTPYLEVDVDRMTRNLAVLADRARSAGVGFRPHAKTHKCAEIARMQIDSGATGLAVATIGEAEAFADAADITSCTDIFIAYPIWPTPEKAARLRALADRVAANPPQALRMTKRLLREGQHQSLDALLELSAAMQTIAHSTADHHEAVAAMLDKRPPRFTGN